MRRIMTDYCVFSPHFPIYLSKGFWLFCLHWKSISRRTERLELIFLGTASYEGACARKRRRCSLHGVTGGEWRLCPSLVLWEGGVWPVDAFPVADEINYPRPGGLPRHKLTILRLRRSEFQGHFQQAEIKMPVQLVLSRAAGAVPSPCLAQLTFRGWWPLPPGSEPAEHRLQSLRLWSSSLPMSPARSPVMTLSLPG